jgi:hypothetical protein
LHKQIRKMTSYSKLPKSLLTLGLCALAANQAMGPPTWAQNLPARIDIIVTEGEGVVNDVRQRVTRNLAVRVEDDDHRPLTGASVVFALPISGASGEFPNGVKNLTAVTNQDGLAVAHGLRTNQIPGTLQIYVTASYRGLRGRALITQTIAGEPVNPKPEMQSRKSGGKWKWVVLGVVAAAGAGGGVYYGTHKSPSSSPTGTSISIGTIGIGGPH